jgi:hypothetical protein
VERFCLRVRHEPKRGNVWELLLYPESPHSQVRVSSARNLSSASAPVAVKWLREVARPMLPRADPPIDADAFGHHPGPLYLNHHDGMRLALAFSAARYLSNSSQRRRFYEGLMALPEEVLLYWFTLCFYGYRQAAGRAALRTLLIHEEHADGCTPAAIRRRKGRLDSEPGLFDRFDTSLQPASAATDVAGVNGQRDELVLLHGKSRGSLKSGG